MTIYIQCKGENGLETVDEAETRKEAKEMITEYRMCDKVSQYYTSSRACKEWREAS
jgi:hypothetical protein